MIGVLTEALSDHFNGHHGLICQKMLERIDELTTRISQLSAKIEEQIARRSRLKSPSSMKSSAPG